MNRRSNRRIITTKWFVDLDEGTLDTDKKLNSDLDADQVSGDTFQLGKQIYMTSKK